MAQTPDDQPAKPGAVRPPSPEPPRSPTTSGPDQQDGHVPVSGDAAVPGATTAVSPVTIDPAAPLHADEQASALPVDGRHDTLTSDEANSHRADAPVPHRPAYATEIDPRDVPTAEWTMPPDDDHPDPVDDGTAVPVWPAPEPVTGQPRRSARWVAMVVVLAILLCGGGAVSAYLLVNRAVLNADNSDGAPDPTSAVNRFLTAVYSDQDVKAAAGLVCREARDTKKLTEKINQIKGYATTYPGPRFTWTSPVVADQNKERAVVSVRLTMTTEDEKSSEQRLTVTTIKKAGWWVCEVAG